MIDIEVKELKEKRDNGDGFILIDVRENFEFGMYNIGGKLIPLSLLPSKAKELQPFQNDEIVVVCRSGLRSATAKEILEQLGFKKVRNLVGGILAWQSAGYLPGNKK